ncbi:hypothetical protein M427DRAFT_492162 [Gonapodya prolifera JEL478]|uniref:Uncharacterized protein n=1 Tax=Gonapodya prolifera (strain JEL478) TaxID=1344416 RepID=A0A139AL91_GONPJ|nr:hypothetical protein M427DRAFT_492162 [Gonapodya prolifera JEL478]|eukprot:KXS17510.1 hypothetical protein M427DRAFT_492162 [Gonapodya prolifera JEL478]
MAAAVGPSLESSHFPSAPLLPPTTLPASSPAGSPVQDAQLPSLPRSRRGQGAAIDLDPAIYALLTGPANAESSLRLASLLQSKLRINPQTGRLEAVAQMVPVPRAGISNPQPPIRNQPTVTSPLSPLSHQRLSLERYTADQTYFSERNSQGLSEEAPPPYSEAVDAIPLGVPMPIPLPPLREPPLRNMVLQHRAESAHGGLLDSHGRHGDGSPGGGAIRTGGRTAGAQGAQYGYPGTFHIYEHRSGLLQPPPFLHGGELPDESSAILVSDPTIATSETPSSSSPGPFRQHRSHRSGRSGNGRRRGASSTQSAKTPEKRWYFTPFKARLWLILGYALLVDLPLAVFCFAWVLSTLLLSVVLMIVPFVGVPVGLAVSVTWRALAKVDLYMLDAVIGDEGGSRVQSNAPTETEAAVAPHASPAGGVRRADARRPHRQLRQLPTIIVAPRRSASMELAMHRGSTRGVVLAAVGLPVSGSPQSAQGGSAGEVGNPIFDDTAPVPRNPLKEAGVIAGCCVSFTAMWGDRGTWGTVVYFLFYKFLLSLATFLTAVLALALFIPGYLCCISPLFFLTLEALAKAELKTAWTIIGGRESQSDNVDSVSLGTPAALSPDVLNGGSRVASVRLGAINSTS